MSTSERPIIFGANSIRAILSGNKVQTRRVIKPQPSESWMRSEVTDWSQYYKRNRWGRLEKYLWICHPTENKEIVCPYGKPGDRLWCRETWWHYRSDYLEQAGFEGGTITLLANGTAATFHQNEDFTPAQYEIWTKKNPLFMPRWASRITLEITNVRVERLQEISAADAKAEGADPFLNRDATAWRAGFQIGWDLINAKRGYSWESNPWVWVLEFRKL